MSLFAQFLSYSEILVENRRFEPTPPLFSTPFGVTTLEFRPDFWRQKTRVPYLSYGIVCIPTVSHLSKRPTCDRWPDRQTM